jgi:hypothetical protein
LSDWSENSINGGQPEVGNSQSERKVDKRERKISNRSEFIPNRSEKSRKASEIRLGVIERSLVGQVQIIDRDESVKEKTNYHVSNTDREKSTLE